MGVATAPLDKLIFDRDSRVNRLSDFDVGIFLAFL
jgi:hypothetical protein